MIFERNKAGQFRANPNALNTNALRIVDTAAPGSPAEDSGSVATTDGEFSGIKYTGKDGASKVLQFRVQQAADGQLLPYTIPAASALADPKLLQTAIHNETKRHEVDGIVSVTEDAGTLSITHVGSGTLEAVIYKGAEAGGFSRADITGLAVGVAATSTAKETKAKASTDAKPKSDAKS